MPDKRDKLRQQLAETAGWDKPTPSDKRAKLQAQLAETAGWDAKPSPPAVADVSVVHGSDTPEEIHIHLTLNITNPPIVNNVNVPAQPAPIVNIENKIEPTPIANHISVPAQTAPVVNIENKVEPTPITNNINVPPPVPPVTRDIVITKNSANEWSAIAKPG